MAFMVAELFGARIHERAAGDAVKPLRDAYPQGYAALQFDASCGSSLHGRIVAMAFARPRINLVHASEAQPATKQAAFAATWEPQGIAATTVADGLADAIGTALETDVALMRHTAADMARRYRLGILRVKPLTAGSVTCSQQLRHSRSTPTSTCPK